METGFRKWIIVVTVVLCVLLELIDTSIVNVALTQMMGNLSATQQEVSWVVASYGIANENQRQLLRGRCGFRQPAACRWLLRGAIVVQSVSGAH